MDEAGSYLAVLTTDQWRLRLQITELTIRAMVVEHANAPVSESPTVRIIVHLHVDVPIRRPACHLLLIDETFDAILNHAEAVPRVSRDGRVVR